MTPSDVELPQSTVKEKLGMLKALNSRQPSRHAEEDIPTSAIDDNSINGFTVPPLELLPPPPVQQYAPPQTTPAPIVIYEAQHHDNFRTVDFAAIANSAEDTRLPRGSNIISSNPGYDEDRWEMCIVLPVDANSKGYTERGKKFMKKLVQSGAEIYSYLDHSSTYIFVLFRYTERKLTAFADLTDYEMMLDPIELQKRCERGCPEENIAPVVIFDDRTVCKYSPYEYIHARYEVESPSNYYVPPGAVHPMTDFHRQKVIKRLLQSPQTMGGAQLDLRRYVLEGDVVAYFPMPDPPMRDFLMNQWLRICSWPNTQPEAGIRRYFGEKVSLYFSFSGLLTQWLIVPAGIGVAFECVVVAYFDFSHPVIPFFTVVMAVWSVLFTEFWKRKEATIALKFGMIDFEETEDVRPEFKGELRPSMIDGKTDKYYPLEQQRGWLSLTGIISALLILATIGIVASIYYMRFVLYQQNFSQAQVVASVVNAVQIWLVTFVYNILAFKLTDLENQRTDTDYEDSMIMKLFLFQFCNNYASFYYIAFIAPWRPNPPDSPNTTGECGFQDCMEALAVNLGIVFGLRLLLTNILIRLILFLTQCCRRQQIMGKTNRPLSLAEQEFVKEPYLLPDNLLLNYSDSCTFFGYAVLFSSALPAAPAFAFLNKFTDLRYEAYQLLYLYRRPVVSGAEDIGNWQTCFEILSTLGVVTNAGLLVFTMKTLLLPGWTIYGRMWIFIGFQWALYISQLLIRIAVPDVPVKVTIQKKRQDFIVSKIIFKEPDEDSTDVLSCTKLEEFKDYPPIRDDGPSSSRSPFNESPIL